MKPVNNWDQVKAASDRQQLPKGGYVCRIMNGEIKTYNGTKGTFERLEISIDVAEGEFKDFTLRITGDRIRKIKNGAGSCAFMFPRTTAAIWTNGPNPS